MNVQLLLNGTLQSFCIRQAVNLLKYRNAHGKAYAELLPDGPTLEQLEEQVKALGPAEDCGCGKHGKPTEVAPTVSKPTKPIPQSRKAK